VLVGRDAELAQLHEARASARGRRGGLVLVTGEAGIGKTRLVEAATAGDAAVWGRCWESGGAPTFWPWVEVLRELAAKRGTPQLQELAPGSDAAVADAGARFALFDGVAQLLLTSAATEPLLVVLDDVHASDPASLRLLELLAPRLTSAPLLVVATFRLADGGTDRAVERMLAALVRRGEHLPLAGLDPSAARSLALASARTRLPSATVDRLVARAEGNPFFVEALAAGSAGDGLALPAGVGEALARRLEPLPDPTRDVLAAAAVIGRDFTIARVARLLGIEAGEALALVDPAARAGLVLPAGEHSGQRFAHMLIRDWLYAGLEASARAELHRREARALEQQAERDPELLQELAHHVAAAAPIVGAGAAVTACERAARHATAGLAFEDAAALYARALAIADDAREPLEPARRVALLLAQGDACLRAGDAAAAREALHQAADLARANGFARELAQAALGYGRVVVLPGEVDEPVVTLLEQALEVVPPEATALRARLLARLARELHFAPDPERPRALAGEAVALADADGDAAHRAYALAAWHVAIDRPELVEERLEVARRITALAGEAGDREVELEGRVMSAIDLLELGLPGAAALELDAADLLAARLRQPALTWRVLLIRTTLALVAGRFDEAERLMAQAEAVGARSRGRGAHRYRLLQEGQLRELRGGYAELEEEARALAEETSAVWGFLHTHLLATIGRLDEARVGFERLVADDFGPPDHMAALSVLARCAEVCALLQDTERAQGLHDRLLPYADCWSVGAGGVCTGVVRLRLGMLDRTLGRYDEAVAQLEKAVAAHREAGAAPATARAEVELALALRALGRDDDAAELLGHALRLAKALGMAPLVETIEAIREGGGAPGQARLEREGEYWVVGFAGREIRLRDRKGVGYLAALLEHPHQELSALQLASGDEAAPADDAGEMLDAEASRAYRRRIEELRAEIDEAERWNDPERAERGSAELEFVAAELSRAVGLGGRGRRAASQAERARVSVTRALRSAIAAMAEQHEQLGAHLDGAIRTGTYCRYAPSAGDEVVWSSSRSASK